MPTANSSVRQGQTPREVTKRACGRGGAVTRSRRTERNLAGASG